MADLSILTVAFPGFARSLCVLLAGPQRCHAARPTKNLTLCQFLKLMSRGTVVRKVCFAYFVFFRPKLCSSQLKFRIDEFGDATWKRSPAKFAGHSLLRNEICDKLRNLRWDIAAANKCREMHWRDGFIRVTSKPSQRRSRSKGIEDFLQSNVFTVLEVCAALTFSKMQVVPSDEPPISNPPGQMKKFLPECLIRNIGYWRCEPFDDDCIPLEQQLEGLSEFPPIDVKVAFLRKLYDIPPLPGR